MGFLSNAASSVKNMVAGGNNEAEAVASPAQAGKLFGECPKCGCSLSYEKSHSSVYCEVCEKSYDVSTLLNKAGGSKSNGGAGLDIAAIAMSIDSPDSGLVYLESFFESYDWDYYKTTSVVGIEEIDGMVEKNKIKNGANPKAWVLDFKSKAIPLIKKIEGLKDLEAKMAEKYNTIDNSEALEDFDVYTRVIKNIFDTGSDAKNTAYASPSEAILKKLSTDIDYAKKFGADVSDCSEMESLFASLKSLISGLKLPEKLDEVSSIAKKKDEISKEKEKELAALGIDAKYTYEQAVEIFDSTVMDKSRALELFESVRGYRDSTEYIQKINLLFNYKNKFFTVGGKYYILEEEKEVFDPNEDKEAKKEREKQKKAEAEEDDGVAVTTYAVYEIVDGSPSKDPVIKGVTKLLGNYGNKLYFIQKKKNICCYDIYKQIETVIDEGKKGYYETTDGRSNLFFANDGKGFFMRKLISIEKVGCFKAFINSIKDFFKNLFKKKKDKKPFVRKNNYTILYVDMVKATASYSVKELLDITKFDSKTNTLFYIVADNNQESDALYFYECDVITGHSRQILDDSCEVHDIVNNKIIYSVWTPNDFNKNLYAMDIETEEKTLIEKNIYEYCCAIKDRVYYTVGNASYEPFFSNNLEGTDRLEIMQNVESIIGERGGWIYFIKSNRRIKYKSNRVLMKMSCDGKQTIVVCSQLKDLILFTDSNVFYIDCFDRLCVVRSDGQDLRVIAPDIEKENVVVAEDGIFYLRDEMVDEDNYESSLYKMDLTGHNTRKLMFNVYGVENCDKDSLFITREEDIKFEITAPISLKKNDVFEEWHHVTRYYRFNKATEEAEVILATGLPDVKTGEFKKGCLRKKIKAQGSYRELPRPGFKYNTAEAGSAYKAQIAQQKAIKANKKKRK